MIENLEAYAKALLARVGYREKVSVIWADQDTASTDGITIKMPREYLGLKLDGKGKRKMARNVAKGLVIHEIGHFLQPLRDMQKVEQKTGLKHQFMNIAADVQLERVAIHLFASEVNYLLIWRAFVWRKMRKQYLIDFPTATVFSDQADCLSLIGRYRRKKKPYTATKKVGTKITSFTNIIGDLRMYDLTMMSVPESSADLPSFLEGLAQQFPDLCNKSAKPEPSENTTEDADGEEEDGDGDEETEDGDEEDGDGDEETDEENDSDTEDEEDEAPDGSKDSDLPEPTADEKAQDALNDAMTRVNDIMNTLTVKLHRGRPMPEAMMLASRLRLQLRKTSVSSKIIAPVTMDRRKMAIGDCQPWYMERFSGVAINRSLTVLFDVSGSMTPSLFNPIPVDRLHMAMVASQALCLAVESERGSVCGGQFGKFGLLTPDMDASPLFSQPAVDRSMTSLKLLTSVWLKRPDDQIIVITDGIFDPPSVIKPVDRERTHIIVIGSDSLPGADLVGHVHYLADNELQKLPEIMLNIAN